MPLAHDQDRIWITTGPGVSAETPGNVAAVIKDPLPNDDEEQSPVLWWLNQLPNAKAS